jgi:pimeloyl-ACP methyl ester carboxylesterase
MAVIDRSGVKLHYEVHGEGPVVLLSHGYSATSGMWRGQVEALSRTHKVVTWDMRGHGQSDYPADQNLYSQAATVDDMAAILDAVGATTAVVGGLSLGGFMSLAFYVKYPERVRALLIIDTGPGFKKDEAREGWNKTALETARAFEAEGLARLKSRSAEMAGAKHRSADGLIKAARGMLTQHDATVINALPEIRVPSLVVVGADDKPFLAAADYMAAKIPGAKKVVIANAGHAANIDQPAAFNTEISSFLAALPA